MIVGLPIHSLLAADEWPCLTKSFEDPFFIIIEKKNDEI